MEGDAGAQESKHMNPDNFDHGYLEELREAARTEAGDPMIAVAARRCLIVYSDRVAGIRSLDLEPQDVRLACLPGEVSTAEHEAGRGMLTVVVVHKHGDRMPGPGFFQFVRSLGHYTNDREAFQVAELEKVYAVWSTGRETDGRLTTVAVVQATGDGSRSQSCRFPIRAGLNVGWPQQELNGGSKR